MRLEMYSLDSEHFLIAPGLAWQPALEKTKVKLDLLTGTDMLLMAEKGIRGEICHAIHRYAKANNKYMKDCYKNKESPYLKYRDVNNLCGCAISQKLPVYGFKWFKNTSQFMKISWKTTMKIVMKDIFLKLMLNISNN